MKSPVVVLRVSCGVRVGLGHLRRCLTLAETLRSMGVDPCFIINRDPESADTLHRFRYRAFEVEDDEYELDKTDYISRTVGAAAVIIDSYQVSARSLKRLYMPVAIILDDRPEWPLEIDLLVNGSADPGDLDHPRSSKTKLLLGPNYVLLRHEFSEEPRRLYRENIERILVTTGGGDVLGMTPTLVAWAKESIGLKYIDVVIGPYFPLEVVRRMEELVREDRGIALHRNPQSIRSLMLASDLALTGGGQTTYELAATGTPTIAIGLADNQTGNLMRLSSKAALMWIGEARDKDLEKKVRHSLAELSNVEARRAMGLSGRRLVDGRGSSRVAKEVLHLCRATEP